LLQTWQELYYALFNEIVEKASEAYLKAAKCEQDEALSANLYVESANCLKKVSTKDAVAVMEQAIEIFCSTGSIRMVFND
jgi:hypothetical protein